MHVDLRVSGYISVCVDIDISCQGVLEKRAPLRWLDLEWKGACLLCWQDMGVLHDRWPEQGREDPPPSMFGSSRVLISVPQGSYLALSDGFSFPHLHSVTQCFVTEMPRGQRIQAPCSYAGKGNTLVGSATGHRCAHLSRKGWRALQQHFPMCDV